MKNWWKDFRRGYSDEDVESAKSKMMGTYQPGQIVPMTKREIRACIAGKV